MATYLPFIFVFFVLYLSEKENAMITFKAIIIQSGKRRDGTYPVKIRVTFGGKTRRLPTNLVCKQEDLTRGGRIKSAFILNKAEETIQQMRAVAAEIPVFELEGRDVDWVVDFIKAKLSRGSFQLDFFEFGEQYINIFSESTRSTYSTALNTFAMYLGRRKCDINSINKPMLQGFVEYLSTENRFTYSPKEKGVKVSKVKRKNNLTTVLYMSKLSTIFNAAKDKYNDEDIDLLLIPHSPFSRVRIVKDDPEGQESIGHKAMQMLIDADTNYGAFRERRRSAIDVLVISFCFMGANMADLYNALRPESDVWEYNRQKTRTRRRDKARMNIVIPECVKPYLARMSSGKRSKWMLPLLHEFYADKDAATGGVNRMVKTWAKKNGLPEFTFYAIRHTWADIARNEAKIPKWLVDECLAHVGDFDLTDIYASRNWKEMAEANAKVLALFKWPTDSDN